MTGTAVTTAAKTVKMVGVPTLHCGGCGRHLHVNLDGKFPLTGDEVQVEVECKHDGCPSSGIPVALKFPVVTAG